MSNITTHRIAPSMRALGLWLLLGLAMGCGEGADPPEAECATDDPTCATDPNSNSSGGGGLPGLPPCGTLFLCVDACLGDVSCEAACGEGLEAHVLTYHGQIQSCLLAHDCHSLGEAGRLASYDACVFEHCLGPYQNCFGPLKQGGETCGASLECMNECDSLDDSCLHDCGTGATLEAQTLYFQILACTETNCQGRSGAIWETCANNLCETEVEICHSHQVD